MRDRRTFSPPAVGGSSLLVIFAVLCLTVFALLALSTAQANRRLSDAAAQAVSDYYRADTRAETILAQLRCGQMPAGVTADGDIASYSCEISDTQELLVSVRISDGSYTVLRWQTVSTAEWKPDSDLPVWNGESDEENGAAFASGEGTPWN